MGTTEISIHARIPEGITLENIATQLSEIRGWEAMEIPIPMRCCTHDSSIKSGLTFLRRTPWALSRVEALYLRMLNHG